MLIVDQARQASLYFGVNATAVDFDDDCLFYGRGRPTGEVVMRINSDGGTAFDGMSLKVNVMRQCDLPECLSLLRLVRGGDSSALRNVLSVAVYRLTEEQAVAMCDVLIGYLETGKV